MFTNLLNKLNKAKENLAQRLFPESSLKQGSSTFLNTLKGFGKTFVSFLNFTKSFGLFKFKEAESGLNLGKAFFYGMKSYAADTQKDEEQSWELASAKFNQFKANCSELYQQGGDLASAGLDFVSKGAETAVSAAETGWHAVRATGNGLINNVGAPLVSGAQVAASTTAELASRASAVTTPVAKQALNAIPSVLEALSETIPSPIAPAFKLASQLLKAAGLSNSSNSNLKSDGIEMSCFLPKGQNAAAGQNSADENPKRSAVAPAA